MGKHIVIVEDEEEIIELLEYNLQKEGYETIGFLNTNNVTQILEKENIDILIIDRHIHGGEGIEFIVKISPKRVPNTVIHIIAKHKESHIDQCLSRSTTD